MKLDCLKEKINSSLSQVVKLTSKNTSLPILECVHLEAKNNTLIIRATNLDIGAEVTLSAKVTEEGSVAVPASIFGAVIANLNDDSNVNIECIDNVLHIKTKKSHTKISTQKTDDFPTIPKLTDGTSVMISPKEFIGGIKSVWYSAATTSIKPELSSVLVTFDDGMFITVATDSYRLAEKKIKAKKIKEFPTILIPVKNVIEIVRLLEGNDDEVEIIVSKNQISFIRDTIYITCRVVEGIFPDYKQIIPKDFKSEAVILKADLQNSLKMVNVFGDNLKQVKIVMNTISKEFRIETKNSQFGENSQQIDAALTGDEVTLSFNYKYLNDCFQSITEDSVVLRFNGPQKPLIVQGVGDRSFLYLVMPIAQ